MFQLVLDLIEHQHQKEVIKYPSKHVGLFVKSLLDVLYGLRASFSSMFARKR